MNHQARSLDNLNGGLVDGTGIPDFKDLNIEVVVSGRQVGVIGRVRRGGCAPIAVKAVQHIAKPESGLRTQLDGRECKLQPAVSGLQHDWPG